MYRGVISTSSTLTIRHTANLAQSHPFVSLLSINLPSKRYFSTQGTISTEEYPPQHTLGRRVVVTGIGIVTPFGTNLTAFWDQLTSGSTAIQTITDESITSLDLPCKVAAPVTSNAFNLKEFVGPASIALTSRFEAFAIAASSLALQDAKYSPNTQEEQERSGVAIGSGIGCLEEIASSARTLTATPRGARRLSSYTLPRFLVNLGAGHVSIAHKFKGPNHSVATACATGAHSIGDAYRFIKYGDADVMLAGGTESSVSPLSLAMFNRIHALSRNPDPLTASRPFDKERDGFVMGEGAAIVVLEEENHAKRRGAQVYAEIVGYGLSGDAHHVTTPPDDGDGAARSMRSALKNAGLKPEDVDYLNAHATSTPLGDVAELAAVKAVFGDRAFKQKIGEETNEQGARVDNPLAISSTKGAVGHMLGAAGAIEAVASIMAIARNQIPPTTGVTQLDDNLRDYNIIWTPPQTKGGDLSDSSAKANTRHDADIPHNINKSPLNGVHPKRVNVALTNSFGFGGSNATLVFKSYKQNNSD